MKSTEKSYRALKQQLEEVLDWFENSETVDIDVATEKYAQAAALISEMESYLAETKSKIEKPKKGS